MSERIARLYAEGRLTAAQVERAVTLGWISTDDAAAILGS